MRLCAVWAAGAVCVFVVAVMLVLSCTRDHENPLDPANAEPFNLRAEGMVGRIRLAWDIPDVPGLDSTVVYRKDFSADSTVAVVLVRVAVPETTYTDRDVTPEVRYEYQVAAAAHDMVSRRSDPVSAVPRGVDAPYGLTVTDTPSDQGTCLNVSWRLSPMDTAGGDVTGYVVARATVLQGPYEPVDTVAAGWTSATDCGLTPGTLYYYRVYARAGSLLSEPTEPYSAIPVDQLPPAPPATVEAADHPDDGGGAIDVAWGLSPDDGGGAGDVQLYEVYRALGADTSLMVRVGSTQAGTGTFVDRPVQNGTVYFYRVRARDSASFSAYSVAASAVAADNGMPQPPAPPGDLRAINPPDDGGGRIQLLWQKSPDDLAGGGIEGYRIYRTTQSGVYGQPLATVAAGTVEYFDTSVVDLTPYFYRATAFRDTLESVPSNEAGPVQSDDELPPAAISDLVATPGQLEGEAVLAWTAPGDNGVEGRAARYFVKFAADSIVTETAWFSATPVTSGVPTPGLAGSREQMTARGLPTSGEVWFCVRAVDDRNNLAGFSNAASTSAQADVTPPGYVDDLMATQAGALEGQVMLMWTATGDDGEVGTASHYEMRASLTPITSLDQFDQAIHLADPPVPKPAGQQETYVATGLVPNTKYYFRLRVFDEVNNGSVMSAQVSEFAQVDVTPPGTIADLAASGSHPALVEGQVILTWTATGDDADSGGAASAYQLKYRQAAPIGPGDWNNPACVVVPVSLQPAAPAEPESLIVSGLTPGVWHFFALRVVDDTGNISAVSNSPQALPQTDVTRPAPVTDLAASGNAPGIVEGQVQLTWTAVGDDSLTGNVSGYQFRYHSLLITEETWAAATPLDAAHILRGPSLSPPGQQDTLVAKNLTPGSVFYFACKAVDDHGRQSGVSNSPHDTVQVDITPPAKVTTLEALTGPYQGALEARWIAVGDDSISGGPALQYDLRYRMGSPITTEETWAAATQVADEPTPSAPGMTDSLIITGLPQDVMHYVALKVRDDRGNWSALSNSPGAASGADVTPPPDVLTFTVQPGDRTLLLAWTPPTSSDYEGVLIGRRTGAPVNTVPQQRPYAVGDVLPDNASTVVYVGGGVSWADTGLINGTTYHYRAFSYDEVWNYSEGRQASGTPADTAAPAPVTGFSARQVQGGIRLAWTNPSTADFQSVMIRYGTTSSPATPTAGTLVGIEPGTPSAADSLLHASPAEQTHFYAAFAMDEVPNYSTAANDSATYDITPPVAVGHLVVTSGTGVDTLTWENPPQGDHTGIIVLSREGSAVVDLPAQGVDYAGQTSIGTSTILGILAPTATTFIDTGLTDGQTYHYAVIAFDWRFNYSAAATGQGTPGP